MDHERRIDPAGEASRLEGFDLRLSAALQDVPVPAGLADRILNRLQANAALSESHVAMPAAASRLRFTRRKGVLYAAAASLLVATGAWVLYPRDAQLIEAADLAKSWSDSFQLQQPTKWRPMSNAPKALAISANSIRVPAAGWVPVNAIVGATGVAYDVSIAQAKAIVFVVKMANDPALSSMPPAVPQSTTGGLTIGLWQKGGYRFALVVSGNVAAYRALLIDSNEPPLAWTSPPAVRTVLGRTVGCSS